MCLIPLEISRMRRAIFLTSKIRMTEANSLNRKTIIAISLNNRIPATKVLMVLKTM